MKFQMGIIGLALTIASILHITGASPIPSESGNSYTLADSVLLATEVLSQSEKTEILASNAQEGDKAFGDPMQPILQVPNREDKDERKDELVPEKSPKSSALSSSPIEVPVSEGEASDSKNEIEKESAVQTESQFDDKSATATQSLPVTELSLRNDETNDILTVDPINHSHVSNSLQNESMPLQEDDNIGEHKDKSSAKSLSNPSWLDSDNPDLKLSDFDSNSEQNEELGAIAMGSNSVKSSSLPDSERIDFGAKVEGKAEIPENGLSSGESVSVEDVKLLIESDASALDAQIEESPSHLPISNLNDEFEYCDEGEDEADISELFNVTTVSVNDSEHQVLSTSKTEAKPVTENAQSMISPSPSPARPNPPPKPMTSDFVPSSSIAHPAQLIDQQNRTETPLPASCPFAYNASNNPTNFKECPFASQKPRASHLNHDQVPLQSATKPSSPLPRPAASPQEDPSNLYLAFVNAHLNSSPVPKRRISPRKPIPTSLLFPDIAQENGLNCKSPGQLKPIPNTLASSKTPRPCANSLVPEPAVDQAPDQSTNVLNSVLSPSNAFRANQENPYENGPLKQDAEWSMNCINSSPPSTGSRCKSLSPKQIRKQDIKWFKKFLKPSRHSAHSRHRNPLNFYGDEERLVYEVPIAKNHSPQVQHSVA